MLIRLFDMVACPGRVVSSVIYALNENKQDEF